jgi:signal transduction histidine kinase
MSREARHDATRLPPGLLHRLPDARRAGADQLAKEIQAVGTSPVVSALLDAVDAVLLVLNAHRQVVAFNGPSPGRGSGVAGLRPGEVLACVNARGPGGCGTQPGCQSCGALGAILGCEEAQRPVEAEALISTEVAGRSLEFNVRATPLSLDGARFTVVSLRDVSAEKRKEALEQVFLHDVLNALAGLRGWAHHLRRPGTDPARAGERIDALSRQLERDVRDHRALVAAERGELSPRWAPVSVRELLDEVAATFAQHTVARDRTLEVATDPELTLETDRALLARVLINMVRNALEATPEGDTVRLACAAAEGGLRFTVHNAGEIPAHVQARIFQRSFSTKAQRGRGLGTYGMRLLGERYLGGRVSFVSTAAEGTTFIAWFPVRAPADGGGEPAER